MRLPCRVKILMGISQSIQAIIGLLQKNGKGVSLHSLAIMLLLPEEQGITEIRRPAMKKLACHQK